MSRATRLVRMINEIGPNVTGLTKDKMRVQENRLATKQMKSIYNNLMTLFKQYGQGKRNTDYGFKFEIILELEPDKNYELMQYTKESEVVYDAVVSFIKSLPNANTTKYEYGKYKVSSHLDTDAEYMNIEITFNPDQNNSDDDYFVIEYESGPVEDY